jgi:hypothetical protein
MHFKTNKTKRLIVYGWPTLFLWPKADCCVGRKGMHNLGQNLLEQSQIQGQTFGVGAKVYYLIKFFFIEKNLYYL